MKTFGDLKASVRQRLFPTGEANNLVVAHDKSMVDGMIDLQHWVPCLQSNHTYIVPQCSTAYRHGLTVCDAPAGIIRRLQVVDRINPETKKEDATAPLDWDNAVNYAEISALYIHSFLKLSQRNGFCLSMPWFFGFSGACGCHRSNYAPVPPDTGLPSGLAPMPLGFHYPQPSTDRTYGRAGSGVWAKERGQIFIAPWIQSTESIVIYYDGIQINWPDDAIVDEDPLLETAIYEYLRWQHADKYDRDPAEAERAMNAYQGNAALGIVGARPMLIHQCRERTRVRDREVSLAIGTDVANGNGPVSLFYNTSQQATANCPNGQSGSPVTITIPAGTVSSTISVVDANQKALGQAQQQAQAQLSCDTLFKSNPQSYTAQCTSDSDHPAPEGNPVTINLPAGAATSNISQADADAQALLMAKEEASSQLKCTFWNKSITYTAKCPDNSAITNAATVAAHTYSSTLSQTDADNQATAAAKAQAEQGINCDVGPWHNTETNAFAQTSCLVRSVSGGSGIPGEVLGPSFQQCLVQVSVTVGASKYTSLVSQADANQQAYNAGTVYAQQMAAYLCRLSQCGYHEFQI